VRSTFTGDVRRKRERYPGLAPPIILSTFFFLELHLLLLCELTWMTSSPTPAIFFIHRHRFF
jgi:hypothetical protein